MTDRDAREDLVPLRTEFDVVWRGFDRDQVRHYVSAVEADFRLLAVDRDAAVARAEDLARQLEEARARIRDLDERLDRVCRTPVEPDALSERLRRMLELAHAEADDVTTRARAAAEQSWATAHHATERLRERHERLVAALDARRHEMETEHRDLMRRALEQVGAMTRQAEQRRRDLDAQAARLREQVEADFEVAMAARRAEALREIADQRAAARAEADRLVREARDHAHHILTTAQDRVDRLDARRAGIAASLRTAERLLDDLDPLLAPRPEEAGLLGATAFDNTTDNATTDNGTTGRTARFTPTAADDAGTDRIAVERTTAGHDTAGQGTAALPTTVAPRAAGRTAAEPITAEPAATPHVAATGSAAPGQAQGDERVAATADVTIPEQPTARERSGDGEDGPVTEQPAVPGGSSAVYGEPVA